MEDIFWETVTITDLDAIRNEPNHSVKRATLTYTVAPNMWAREAFKFLMSHNGA